MVVTDLPRGLVVGWVRVWRRVSCVRVLAGRMVGAVGRDADADGWRHVRVWRELELGLHLRVEQHQGHAISHRQRLDVYSCRNTWVFVSMELLDARYAH
jgi:hypothetical protein